MGKKAEIEPWVVVVKFDGRNTRFISAFPAGFGTFYPNGRREVHKRFPGILELRLD